MKSSEYTALVEGLKALSLEELLAIRVPIEEIIWVKAHNGAEYPMVTETYP